MTTIEKQMIALLIVLIVAPTLGVIRLNKALQPVTADIEKNGIKPYVMQFWEGKKN